MRPLRSLGYLTDAALTRHDGIVLERDRYLVIKTPSNPGFRWGNLLVYDAPPAEGDVATWRADIARELPGLSHELVGWDCTGGERGDLRGFLEAGFEEDTSVILTATKSGLRRSPRHDEAVTVRPMATDEEWSESIEVLVAAFSPREHGAPGSLRAFCTEQVARYRSMKDLTWFGAWVDGRMAGALGLFRIGDVGRFQLVGVSPSFARRGVCSSMVHAVATWGFENAHVSTLVMAADAHYHAARVYESVGFEVTERLVAVVRMQRAS